jgi:soluble lytic murein transglycosylase-like protein/tetratricopeptide (TPR) repeat protein
MRIETVNAGGRGMYKYIAVLILLGTIADAEERNPVSYNAFYLPAKKIISSLKDNNEYEALFALANAYKTEKDYANSVKQYLRAAGSADGQAEPDIAGSFMRISRKSPYYDDSLFETAEIVYEQSGRRQSGYRSVIRLTDLISNANPYLSFEARLLKSNALVFTGSPEAALAVLNEAMRKSVSDSEKPTGYLRLAFVYGKLGNTVQSLKYYAETVRDFPDSWEALTAALELYNAKEAHPLDTETVANAAVILFRNNRYKEAANMLNRVSGIENPEMYLKSLLRSGDTVRADKFINAADAAVREKYLLLKAENISAGKGADSRALYARLSGSKDHAVASEALYRMYLIDYLKSNETISRNAGTYMSRFPKNVHAEDLLWLRVKTRMTSDASGALDDLKLIENNFPESRSRDRLYYLISVLENEKTEKRKYFQKLLAGFPDSYYAIRGVASIEEKEIPFYLESSGSSLDDCKISHYVKTIRSYDENSYNERIDSLSGKDSFEKEFAGLRLRSTSKELINEYALLEKYFRSGYMRGINRISGNRSVRDSELVRLAAVSDLSQKYGNYYLLRYSTLRIMEALHHPQNIFLMKTEYVKRLLPQAFQRTVAASCALNKTDENLLYAIMLSETSYNHRFRSDAGALGVMQLTKSTAADMAKQLAVKKYSLFDPEDSILLASKYIAKLNARYGEDVRLTAAAYNAGMGNMNIWLQKNTVPDTDRFIEQIPYPETVLYVQSVYKYYVLYQTYYGN